MTRFIKLNNEGAPVKSNHAQVLDTTMRLIWPARNVIPERVNQPEAEKAVASYRGGGLSDWLLPTRAELLSIVDETRKNPAINTEYFLDCDSGWYWTRTPYADDSEGRVWIVGFRSGGAHYVNRDLIGFVRAVRQATADDLAKAGVS